MIILWIFFFVVWKILFFIQRKALCITPTAVFPDSDHAFLFHFKFFPKDFYRYSL